MIVEFSIELFNTVTLRFVFGPWTVVGMVAKCIYHDALTFKGAVFHISLIVFASLKYFRSMRLGHFFVDRAKVKLFEFKILIWILGIGIGMVIVFTLWLEQKYRGFGESIRIEDSEFACILATAEWMLRSGHNKLLRLGNRLNRLDNIIIIDNSVDDKWFVRTVCFGLLILPELWAIEI